MDALMLLWVLILVGIALLFCWSLCAMSAQGERDAKAFEAEMRRRETRGRL